MDYTVDVGVIDPVVFPGTKHHDRFSVSPQGKIEKKSFGNVICLTNIGSRNANREYDFMPPPPSLKWIVTLKT